MAAKPKFFPMKTSLLFLAGLLMVAPGLCSAVAADGASTQNQRVYLLTNDPA